MDEFNCLKADSLLFITKTSDIPGTHLIDLKKVKGWVNLGATHWVLDLESLD